MVANGPLRVLFPATFSTQCWLAGQAVAQLADRGPVALTLLHVIAPGELVRPAQHALDAFLPALGDRCHVDRTLLVADDAVDAVTAECDTERYDLVMAPGSGRRGVAAFFGRSFRARLLRRSPVPLWTADGCLPTVDFRRPLRTVLCLVDFDDAPRRSLRLASRLASRLGARLRVVCVAPTLDDGTLASMLTSRAPLTDVQAVAWVRRLLAEDARTQTSAVDVDLVEAPTSAAVHRVVRRREADLLVVGPRHAGAGAAEDTLSRLLERAPCPVICVEQPSIKRPGWRGLVASPQAAS